MEEELLFLLDMTPKERRLHFIHQEARYEQAQLDKLMSEYLWLGTEPAEFSPYRKTVRAEIKVRRERIRWLRTQYKTAMQQSS